MIYFLNEDAEYIRWVGNNDHGYVANLGTGRKMLARMHTPRCSHISGPTDDQTHTVLRPKACSRDLGELVAWVRQQGYEVVACGDCEVSGLDDLA